MTPLSLFSLYNQMHIFVEGWVQFLFDNNESACICNSSTNLIGWNCPIGDPKTTGHMRIFFDSRFLLICKAI